MHLFTHTIDGKQDWSRLFCDIGAFAPLVKEVLRRHDLPDAPVTGLTPGTNAVFRAGDYVVKLYAPPESAYDDGVYGRGEWQAGSAAARAGVLLPRPVAYGLLEDAYTFAYMVMEYMTGQELGDVLPACTAAEKSALGAELRTVYDTLHRAEITACSDCCADIVERSLTNFRWQLVPERLAAQCKDRARKVALTPRFLVHGDMTGENILRTPQGMALIDFGDAVVAPLCYELPSLVIEGMRADAAVLAGFGVTDKDAFMENLLDGLSLHDFAGGLIRSYAAYKGHDLQQIDSIEGLRRLLQKDLWEK